MPVILLAGRPCTGKTTVANKLANYFKEKDFEVVIVNEESLNLIKNLSYNSAANEKILRGNLKSSLEHNLSNMNTNKRKIVIFDSLNYIKGFRYEIYCLTRSIRTQYCVVWVACQNEKANEWNTLRISEGKDGFDQTIMNELRQRFESPNENNRWDDPLFRVLSAPIEEKKDNINNEQINTTTTEPIKKKVSSWKPKKKVDTTDATTTPTSIDVTATTTSTTTTSSTSQVTISGSIVDFEDLSQFKFLDDELLSTIHSHIINAPLALPNSSTVTPTHGQASTLFELDNISQNLTSKILQHQANNPSGTILILPDCDRSLCLHRHVSSAEIQRIRQQFVKINSKHPPASTEAIGASFIDFLSAQI